MHFASMSLGIFDFLIDWLTSFLMWIVEWTLGLIMDIIGVLLYDLASSILYLVDIIQQMFRKLCGMDTIWINGEEANYVDPVITVLTDKSVLEILLALTIVAVAMVIIASIIQIIRTEFSTEGSKNTKGQIFGTALKSILMFVIVPVTCVGGLILSNTLLRTIDKATSGAEQSTMGAQIAVSALSSAKKDSDWHGESNFLTMDDKGNPKSGYNYRDTDDVKKYYDLGECNFFILIGSAVIAVYILFTASFGLVMRIYKIVVLFLISPPLVGLMPLYDTAYKEWRRAFIGQVLGAYGTVVTLNLMFQIMPLVNNIDLFPAGSYGNDIGHLLFTLTALFLMKDLPGTISKFIAAEDSGAAGAGAAKAVGGAALKVGMAATGGAAALAMKGAGAAMGGAAKLAQKGGHGKTAKVFGAIGNSIGGTGNRLGQKAKGNFGSVANKALGAMSFGTMKNVFDEEKDYGKAMDAKSKKAADRQQSIIDGTAGIGAYIPGLAAKAEEGISYGLKSAGINRKRKHLKKDLGDLKKSDPAKWSQNMRDLKQLKQKESDLSKAHGQRLENINAGDTSMGGIGAVFRSISTGGSSTIQGTFGNVSLANAAIKNMAGDMGKTYNGVQSDVSARAVKDVVKKLKSGDSVGASQGIDQMIRSLESIADKTEYQSELLQKLTGVKSQINSAAGDPARLANIADNANLGGALSKLASDVHSQAQQTVNVTSSFNVSGNAGDIDSKLADFAKKIESTTGRSSDKIIKQLKEDIEKLKDKKKK